MLGVKIMGLGIWVRKSGLGLLGWKMATLKIHPGWVGEAKLVKFLWWMPQDGLHNLISESG